MKKPTFIIAEIGNNHEGNFVLAKKLVTLAAKAKVDAVKFQVFKTEKNIIMGIAHTSLPIYGFQFHPESIGTDIGKSLLKNFLTLINYGN